MGYTERDIISISIKRAVEMGLVEKDVPLPLGDDSYAFRHGDKYFLLKIDGFSIKSSKPPWASLKDIGWKAVTAAASDIFVKGGNPLYLLLSIGVSVPEDALSLVEGIFEAAKYYSVYIAGGDTNKSETDAWIDIAILGKAPRVLSRSTARPGDYVVTTGYYGATGAAYWALYQGVDPEIIASYECMYKATTRPTALNRFPELLDRVGDCITSSMDVSDGLATTLAQVAEASFTNISLEKLPPIYSCAREFLSKYPVVDEFNAIMYGGEEFEAVFTVKPECLDTVIKECHRVLGKECHVIGKCQKGSGKILYKGRELRKQGWDHFSLVYKTG